MNSIKENKSFQVIVGAFCCYLAWRLWSGGYFSWLLGNESASGFSNADLILSIGAMIVDFLQLVGLAAIGIVSGVLPELQKITGWITVQLRSLRARYKLGADKDDPAFDWRPLIFIAVIYIIFSSGRLNSLMDRVKSVVTPNQQTSSIDRAVFYISDDATDEQKMIANSSAIADLLEGSGVERRVYYSDQDLSAAESWVRELISNNQVSTTSLITESKSGEDRVTSMPDDVQFYKSIVGR